MPWLPELFSAPVVEQLRQKRDWERLEAVPYYDGLTAGEHDALIRSFAGEPVLHDPLNGRVMGARAFEAYVTQLNSWLAERNMSFQPVDDVITQTRAFEEVVLHLDGEAGRVAVPVAIVADRRPDGRLVELRVYHSMLPVVGHRVHRPPMLQRDPELRASDVVAEHLHALADGDVEAILATFEPEPADGLRARYERLFSNGGGIRLDHCALVDTGRACALEYNVVGWGTAELAPEAGVAVYVRGDSGRLTAARVYDEAEPPTPGL